jgi:hypothetical protein
MRKSATHHITTVGALLALTVGVASPGVGSAAPTPLPCDVLAEFHARDFGRPKVDNQFLPLVPGTQSVFEGTVDGVAHRVTFVVTDLVKKVNGVKSVVIWDVDQSEDVVTEAELSFFAQDHTGNVWNLGEYPELYDNGVFVGAPSTWISGQEGAQAGIHMAAQPTISANYYLQGVAPEIGFLDCAKVTTMDQTVQSPAGDFSQVLITNETDPSVPTDGVQVKSYAPGVGIVRIGIENPGAAPEQLELVSFGRLSRSELAAARKAALQLDRRGCRNSEVYCATGRATRLTDD